MSSLSQDTPSQIQPLEPIEIFRAGTHIGMSGVPMTFSAAMLKECAASYDPAHHEAPVVVGHPKTDAPAYGWISGLQVRGDRLVADVRDVDPAFAELVRQRRYSKVSSSFWAPRSPGNPTPGKLALRHVGFLGANPPAVKGLKVVAFADDEPWTLTFGDTEAFSAESIRQEVAAEYEARALRDSNRAFVDKVVGEGRWLACHREGLLAFMDSVANDGVVSFAEGGETRTEAPADLLKRMLGSLPPVVPMGEIDFGSPPDGPDAPASDITLPRGYTASPEGLELLKQATRLQETGGMSFADAVRSIAKQGR